MDDREAIALAKKYIGEIYAEENINSVRLKEFEHILERREMGGDAQLFATLGYVAHAGARGVGESRGRVAGPEVVQGRHA